MNAHPTPDEPPAEWVEIPADDVRRFRLFAIKHRRTRAVGIAVCDFRGLWYVHHNAGNDGPMSEQELRDYWHVTPELDNHHNAVACPYCTDNLAARAAAARSVGAREALDEAIQRASLNKDDWAVEMLAELRAETER